MRRNHGEAEVTAEHEQLTDRDVEDREQPHDQRKGKRDERINRSERQTVHQLLQQHRGDLARRPVIGAAPLPSSLGPNAATNESPALRRRQRARLAVVRISSRRRRCNP